MIYLKIFNLITFIIKSIYLLPSNVYSHFPDIKSHILIDLSPLPLIIFSPFNDKQTEETPSL